MSVALQKIINEVFEKNGVSTSVTAVCQVVSSDMYSCYCLLVHSFALNCRLQGTGSDIGELLIKDKRVDLVSFTGRQSRLQALDSLDFTFTYELGSTAVGQHIQQTVGARFGRALLELGGMTTNVQALVVNNIDFVGNNAVIVTNNCDMEMALRSVLFAAVGTCGQVGI